MKYAVYYRLIAECAVCCKLIAKYVVCRNLLADVANLLQNARFVRFAKDYIRPPRLYGLPQTATNRNNQPQKKIPDVMALYRLKILPLLWYKELTSILAKFGLKLVPGTNCLFING
jgi:hypothetical protein